ncbi:hypothetical protein GCM10020295_48690 [Streptomyces cinereospinus]
MTLKDTAGSQDQVCTSSRLGSQCCQAVVAAPAKTTSETAKVTRWLGYSLTRRRRMNRPGVSVGRADQVRMNPLRMKKNDTPSPPAMPNSRAASCAVCPLKGLSCGLVTWYRNTASAA